MVGLEQQGEVHLTGDENYSMPKLDLDYWKTEHLVPEDTMIVNAQKDLGRQPQSETANADSGTGHCWSPLGMGWLSAV